MKNFKNTLIFLGSPHKNGHTSSVLKFILSFAPETHINTVETFKENIKPCIDCSFCKKSFKCIFDDMNKINDLIENADILIFAFPIYNSSFPAPLKSILDRMQPYYHKKFTLGIKHPVKKPKKSLILTTQGSKNINTQEIIKFQLNSILKLLNASECEYLCVKNTDDLDFDTEKYCEKNKNTIKKITDFLYSDL